MNNRKGVFLLLTLTAFWIAPYNSSLATDRGSSIVYRGGEQGRVIFDGQIHASKGFTCRDCHTDYAKTGIQLFETHKKGLISNIDLDTGTKCFTCHNGRTAFSTCKGCHH